MNELQIFNNIEFGQVRVLEKDGQPWFVGKDVCSILEIKNNRDAVARLDEDEKDVVLTDTLGGKQILQIVNEFGLYSLILGSRKPEAKQFKRWITHDVVPQIRKTGSYQMPRTKKEELQLFAETFREQDEKIEAVNSDLQNFKLDIPLLGIECERITSTVRTKGVTCLGGKQSPSYQNKSLRSRIYSDIYGQLKREFGVTSYKAIKRIQSDLAVDIVKKYTPPFALNEEIQGVNSQVGFDA
jgi:prophage antirepressor-like protein